MYWTELEPGLKARYVVSCFLCFNLENVPGIRGGNVTKSLAVMPGNFSLLFCGPTTEVVNLVEVLLDPNSIIRVWHGELVGLGSVK